MSTISLLERYGRAPSGGSRQLSGLSAPAVTETRSRRPTSVIGASARSRFEIRLRGGGAAHLTREHRAGPASIWRYRDLLPVDLEGDRADHAGARASRPLIHARNLGAEAGAAQSLPEERHPEPDGSFKDRVVSVGRHWARRARAHHHRVCQHRQPRELGCRLRGSTPDCAPSWFVPSDLEPAKG